jgi:hypothetical protein
MAAELTAPWAAAVTINVDDERPGRARARRGSGGSRGDNHDRRRLEHVVRVHAGSSLECLDQVLARLELFAERYAF